MFSNLNLSLHAEKQHALKQAHYLKKTRSAGKTNIKIAGSVRKTAE
jgi:hypothetical protein